MFSLSVVLWVWLIFTTSQTTQANEFPIALDQWYATEPPKHGSDQWLIASLDVEHESNVTTGKTGLQVQLLTKISDPLLPFKIEAGSAKEGLAGKQIVHEVEDGWILGFNAGEFGAGLWWFSRDGSKRSKISDNHVVGFVPTESGLLVVEGFVHGGVSSGKISRLSRDNRGLWQSETFLDLGTCAQVVSKDINDTLVVATNDRLIRVIPSSKKIEVIVEHAFWDGFYPNSIVIAKSGVMYIGMRHGVAKVVGDDSKTKTVWLLPDRRFAEQKILDGFK